MLCGKCKVDKPTTEFCRSSKRSSGFQFWCKACSRVATQAYQRRNRFKINEIRLARYHAEKTKYQTPEYKEYRRKIAADFRARHPNYSIDKYNRDKNRLSYWFNSALGGMRQRSKRRGFPPPQLNSRKSFEKWARENNLDVLWERFVSSNFDSRLKPSIDRIDNSKPYTVDNMRLVTWQENLGSWNKCGNIEHGRRMSSMLVALPRRKRMHCPNGHKYEGESFRLHPKQGRICRICERQRGKNRKVKRPLKISEVDHG